MSISYYRPVLALLGILVLALALTACASAPPPAPKAPQQASTSTGTVVAVRSLSLTGPNDPAANGVNAVLRGLGQPGLAQPATGNEVVIVKPDGNPISAVVPDASNLAPGADVVVLTAGVTTLVKQN